MLTSHGKHTPETQKEPEKEPDLVALPVEDGDQDSSEDPTEAIEPVLAGEDAPEDQDSPDDPTEAIEPLQAEGDAAEDDGEEPAEEGEPEEEADEPDDGAEDGDSEDDGDDGAQDGPEDDAEDEDPSEDEESLEDDDTEKIGAHAAVGAHAAHAKPAESAEPAAPAEPAEPDLSAAVTAAIEPLPPLVPNAPAEFVGAAFPEIPRKRSHRGLKAFGITVGVLAAVVLAVYIAGAVVFMGRFLPNTTMGDKDISLKTDAEVTTILEDIATGYRLDVVGGGFSWRATGEDIGLAFDADGIVSAMHADLDSWRWPLLIIQPGHDETDQLSVSFKKSAYKDELTAAVEKFNETAKDPVDATIEYDKKNDRFIVKQEEAGTKLNPSAVLTSVNEAIEALDFKVSLGDEHLVQPAVRATDEKINEAAELATGMVSAKLTFVIGGEDVAVVDGDTLSNFITVGEDYGVVFKEDDMNAWVNSLVDGFNTIGTERTYTRADGKVIAVSGGDYGWEVDSEALRAAIVEGVKAGKVADIEVPCIATAVAYNGANQPDWGKRYIDVDISEQHVRFYGDDGNIIWEADCISGAPDGKHNTVEGVWSVNAKESPSKLIGYENGKKIYESTVTYWMPFEGNSIGFHDATWQPSFGGSMYANGYGSHGCVNLSYDDAKSLYDIIEFDDVVVVHS